MLASCPAAARASVSSVMKFWLTQSARDACVHRRRRSASTLVKKVRASSTVAAGSAGSPPFAPLAAGGAGSTLGQGIGGMGSAAHEAAPLAARASAAMAKAEVVWIAGADPLRIERTNRRMAAAPG
jgi:hypothetical protein